MTIPQSTTIRLRGFAITVFFLGAVLIGPLAGITAAPFCLNKFSFCIPGGKEEARTLSERYVRADAAVLAQWVGGERFLSEAKPGNTKFQIQQVLKASKPLVAGHQITINRELQAKYGDNYLVFGTKVGKSGAPDWDGPIPATGAIVDYLANAPHPKGPAVDRLRYFLEFLESADPTIASDAFDEFAISAYDDIEQVASNFHKDKIRQWILNPETEAIRLGLYGMMIGLCGDETDAQVLEQRILIQTEEFRLGIDGLMGGYLLLRQDKGLDVLDKHKLRNKNASVFEKFAAMQALRFMWSYGGSRITPERLRRSMRILLDHPEMADLVIRELAQWKDWSVQDRLANMYGVGEYDIPSIKRAIVRYMLASTKDVGVLPDGNPLPHIARGKRLLAELRTKDPKTASEAERFHIVR